MGRPKQPKREMTEIDKQVCDLKGKMKAKDIADKLGLTIHQVYGIHKYFNITSPLNQEFN